MSYLSEQEFDTQMEKIKKKNESIERKRKLKEEKSKYGFKPKFKLPSTSKLVVLVVFIMCIEIMIFAQYASIVLGDSSPLITLIGVPVTLIPTLLAYYSKARAENTKDGLVYEKTMYELNRQDNYYIDEEESVG